MKGTKAFQKISGKIHTEIGGGWGEKALEYAQLPEVNRIFRLKKELLYKIIDEDIYPDSQNNQLDVLDFNCGCGNDFPFFLEKGWHVTGCDGAIGMLNVAFDKYQHWIEKGKLDLYLGRSEEMSMKSFEGKKFDLIFSTTGGFSYVDDAEFIREHKVLLNMLKPGGKILAAHLTPFCFAESMYEILHLRFGKARKRWKGKLKVVVKNEEYNMYLRSSGRIKKLLKDTAEIERKYAILTLSPPYQTGYNPGQSIIKMHKAVEQNLLRSGLAAKVSDQVAFLIQSKSQESNPQ